MRAQRSHAQRLRIGVKADVMHHEPVIKPRFALLCGLQRAQC